MIVVIISTHLRKLLDLYGNIDQIPPKEGYLLLQDWRSQHQCSLEPTFPEIEDESMRVYYQLKPEKEIKESSIQTLRQLDGIDGAYKKADEGLPN